MQFKFSWQGLWDQMGTAEWVGLMALLGLILAILKFLVSLKTKPKSTPGTNISGNTINGDHNTTTISGRDTNITNITYTLPQYERDLRQQITDLTAVIKNQSQTSRVLSVELQTSQEKLAALERSYKERVIELGETKARLQDLQADLPADQYKAAIDAINSGNTALADEILAKIEQAAEKPIEIAAKAAYQRGHIANDNINYIQAYEHFAKAARLQPQTWLYQIWAGRLAYVIGDYDGAQTYLKHALVLAEQDFGPDHPNTANSLNNLAELFRDQGQYEAAEPLYVRALEIRETALGAKHPDTATSLNNLALLYYAQGRYEAAKPLYLRALKIIEAALGPDHPQTATSLNNLAELYRALGRYEAAKPLYLRALKIREAALGPEHPSTAASLNNLAELYKVQGQYEAAKPLYLRAIKIAEAALGADHPQTATSVNNLATLYYSQGRYEAAKPLYDRALEIREAALGPDHPDTAASLNNLAALYKAQGRYEAAKPLYVRAFKIAEKTLGPDHPTTKTIKENYKGLQAHMKQKHMK